MRSRQELREAGENKLFNDEMEYITEGLGKRQPLNVQRIRYWEDKVYALTVLFIFANYNNMRITAIIIVIIIIIAIFRQRQCNYSCKEIT